jgi:hypothetical protein
MTPDQYIEVWFEAAKKNCTLINKAPRDWQPILWQRYNAL